MFIFCLIAIASAKDFIRYNKEYQQNFELIKANQCIYIHKHYRDTYCKNATKGLYAIFTYSSATNQMDVACYSDASCKHDKVIGTGGKIDSYEWRYEDMPSVVECTTKDEYLTCSNGPNALMECIKKGCVSSGSYSTHYDNEGTTKIVKRYKQRDCTGDYKTEKYDMKCNQCVEKTGYYENIICGTNSVLILAIAFLLFLF